MFFFFFFGLDGICFFCCLFWTSCLKIKHRFWNLSVAISMDHGATVNHLNRSNHLCQSKNTRKCLKMLQYQRILLLLYGNVRAWYAFTNSNNIGQQKTFSNSSIFDEMISNFGKWTYLNDKLSVEHERMAHFVCVNDMDGM